MISGARFVGVLVFLFSLSALAQTTETTPPPAAGTSTAPATSEAESPTKVKKKRKGGTKKKKKVHKRKQAWQKIVGPSGSVRLGAFQKDKRYSDKNDIFYLSPWLTLKPAKFWGIQTFLEGNLQTVDSDRGFQTKGDVREGYIQATPGRFGIKLGRQITAWGRADLVNPTDNLSTRDYTRLSSDIEDQRTGLNAAEIAYYEGDNAWIFIWQPEWRNSNFNYPPSSIETNFIEPEDSRQQYAIKFDHVGDDVEYSLSFAYIYDRTPDLVELDDVTKLSYGFNRVRVFGFDLAFRADDELSFQAEVAYTHTRDGNGSDVTVKNPFWFGVLGFDYAPIEQLNFVGQFMFRGIDPWEDPKEASTNRGRFLAEYLNTMTNQKAKSMHGATARLNFFAFDDKFDLELAYISWYSIGDSVFRPKATYEFSPDWKASLGGEWFNGPPDSFYGQFVDLSGAFAEVRYLF